MATASNVEDFPVRMVGLRSLTVDSEIQSRCKTDPAHARGITDFVLKNGPISEPIIVFDDGKSLRPADGFHRIFGYREAARIQKRFQQIRAEIRPGTKRDAIVFSAGANQEKTYLNRKPDDIKRAIFMLLEDNEWFDSTDCRIANHVGVSRNSACRFRREFCRVRGADIPKNRTRIHYGKRSTILPNYEAGKKAHSVMLHKKSAIIVSQTPFPNSPVEIPVIRNPDLDTPENLESTESITSAHGVTGHILNARNDGSYVFRVYGEADPETGRKTFVDYRLAFDDLIVTIADPRAKLVRDGTGDRLVDYQGEG